MSSGVAGMLAGHGLGDDLDGQGPQRAEERRAERAARGGRLIDRPSLAASSRAGRPARPPARWPGEAGPHGSGERASIWTESIAVQGLVMAGRVEELGDQLAPAGQAEPGGVAAARADRRVEAQPERGGPASRVGQVEDQPRALVAQVAEQGLVRPRVVGPPEDERQVGLEQRPDRAGRAGRTASGPARRTIRSEQTCGMPGSGRWQMRRDLGGDLPLGVVRRRGRRSSGRGTASITASRTGAEPPRRRPSSRSTTRLASTIRVTFGCSGSGPPTCSAAGPQSCCSSVSIVAEVDRDPLTLRKASDVASAIVRSFHAVVASRCRSSRSRIEIHSAFRASATRPRRP